MGKKCELSDFDRGIIVAARQGGFSSLRWSPGIFMYKSLEFIENKKTSSEQQFWGQKCIGNEMEEKGQIWQESDSNTNSQALHQRFAEDLWTHSVSNL